MLHLRDYTVARGGEKECLSNLELVNSLWYHVKGGVYEKENC